MKYEIIRINDLLSNRLSLYKRTITLTRKSGRITRTIRSLSRKGSLSTFPSAGRLPRLYEKNYIRDPLSGRTFVRCQIHDEMKANRLCQKGFRGI